MNGLQRLNHSRCELQNFLEECLRDVEKLLHSRDNEEFNFPQVQFRNVTGPCTDVLNPPDLHVVVPENSVLGGGDLKVARWHVAHESIHVLDPHSVPTNYLEEGLATWFQNHKVTDYPGCQYNPWYEAMQRVKPWINPLLTGLKQFRQEQRTKLGDITAETLISYCCVPEEHAAQLVERFPVNPTSQEVTA